MRPGSSVVQALATLFLCTSGPIAKEGKATVFGRGDNPINFNSTKDVARFTELAAFEPGLSRMILTVGGPENITFNQLVGQIEHTVGRKAAVKHIPVPLMRLSSSAMRPFKPDVAGMIEAGIAFQTANMAFDATDLQRLFPQVKLTRMADVLSRQFATALRPTSARFR